MAKKKGKNINFKAKKANISVGKDDVAIKTKGGKKFKVSTKVAVIIVAVLLVIALTGVSCYFFVAPFRGFIDKLFGINSLQRADGELNVHFVDIGQGDFIIIQLPDGKNMVIDAGSDAKGNSDKSGAEIVSDKIEELNINTFDYMLLTHTDKDHVGYMDEILEKCKVLNIYRPMFLSESEKAAEPNSKFACVDTNVYDDFIKAVDAEVAEEGAKEFMNNEKTEPIEGVGYKIDFYNVDESEYYTETVGEKPESLELNAVSAIAVLTYKAENGTERSVAFTGDAEGKEGSSGNGGEIDFVNNYGNKKIDVDVLKAGHHGSKTSTSDEILDFLTPEYCVVSVGTGGKHGHPTAEFIKRVNDYGITQQLFMTKDKGDIRLKINKSADILWSFQIKEAA